MKKTKLLSFVLLFLVAITIKTMAQATGDFGSKATGNWGTDGSNWLICVTPGQWTDATPAANAPTATDNVWIQAGQTITAEASGKTCKNLTVQGTLITTAITSSSNNITISGTLNLTAGSDFQLTGANPYMGTSWANVIVDYASTIEFYGTMTSFPVSLSTAGTKFVCGNLVWAAGTAGLAGTSGELALEVHGNLTINKTTSTSGKIRGCTTNYAGSLTHVVYGDLIMNNSAASNHCLSLVNSAPSPANVTFNVKGNVYLNSGRITMMESSGSTNPTSTLNIDGNLTIGTAAIVQFGSNSANAGTASINIKGNVINNNATISTTAGGIIKNSGGGGSLSINLNGSNAQSWTGLFPMAFTSTTCTVNVNNSAGVSLLSPNTLNGSLALTSGKVSLGANDLTVASTGSLTGASSTSFIITNGAGKLIIPAAAAPATTLIPVGASATSYDPVSVTPTTATNFAVKVYSALSGTSVYGVRYNAKEWDITPVVASSTLIALTPSNLVESVSSPVIGHYVGGSYVNSTATMTNAGTTFNGTFDTFSPFVTGANIDVTGLKEEKNNILRVYPYHNQLMVSGTNAGDMITAYNMNGQLVAKVIASGNLSGLNLNKGLYMLTVKSGNNTENLRVIMK